MDRVNVHRRRCGRRGSINRLLVALCAGAFTSGSAPVFAQGLSSDNDMKPLSKMETQDAKAAAASAKAEWARMTPEQQAAAKKAARAKKQEELTALDNIACNYCYNRIGDFWSPNDPMYRRSMTPADETK
jgi:hypothetical protein